MNDDIFSIDFPILIESTDSGGIAAGCTSNSNYYMSGTQRDTCCCSCDKNG